jgi:hypothetical protein
MFKLLWLAVFGLYVQNFDVASVRPQSPDDSSFFVRMPIRCVFRRKPPLIPMESIHGFRLKASSSRSVATLGP